jgi:hypothetical protein
VTKHFEVKVGKFEHWIQSNVASVKHRKGFLEKISKDFQITKVTNQVTVIRDSAVGTETRSRLDCPGIESRCVARFSAPVQTSAEAHPASCAMGTESFPGVKRPGRGVDHPPTYSAKVKARVELYFYSTSEPSWPVIG